VILLSFLKYPVFAEQLTELPPISTETLMRYYSDLEIELLIEEITQAAHEAIEQAASEAAKAALLSSLEREVAIMRDVQRWRLEAEANYLAFNEAKRTGRKNTMLGVLIGIVSGLVIGTAGTLIIGGR
jgi:hypothetical protein